LGDRQPASQLKINYYSVTKKPETKQKIDRSQLNQRQLLKLIGDLKPQIVSHWSSFD